MSTRLILAADLARTIAQAGVDPTLEGRELQDSILSAIADRRGYLSWDVDHAGLVVTLYHPRTRSYTATRWKKLRHGASYG